MTLSSEQRVKRFFPYSNLRPYQLEASTFIYDVFREGGIGLLSAPCGIGKSIAALAAYLAAREEAGGFRVLVLTRTKNQAEIYSRELRALRERVGVEVAAAIFKSKMEMCLKVGEDEKLRGVGYQDFLRYCGGLKRRLHGRRCEYYEATVIEGWRPTVKARRLVESLVREGASMPDEVYEACKEESLCPYEVTKFLASRADLIIGNYNYALLPPVRASVLSRARIKLGSTAAVFDEAHSLPRYVIDLFSDELSTRSMKRALEEAERFGVDVSLTRVLAAFKDVVEELGHEAYSELGVDEEKIVDPIRVLRDVASRTELEDLEEVVDALNHLEDEGERIRQLKAAEGKPPTSYIARCASFLADWATATESFYAAYVKAVRRGEELYFRLGLKCLDPSPAASVINGFRTAVLMSGTLWSPEYYMDVLGLDKTRCRQLSLPYPFPRRNRALIVDLASTSKYERRGEMLWSKVAFRLNTLLRALKGRAAIYTPSYEVLREVASRLSSDRPLLVEDERTKVVEALEHLRRHPDAVVMGVAGGKLSEGVDFTDAEGKGLLSAVIMVGLPYPKRNQLHEALVEHYRSRFGGLAVEYAREAPCINALAQVAGRLIRGPEDRGAVIIMDYRAMRPRFRARLPEDWREDIKGRRSLERIIEDLASLGLVEASFLAKA